MARETSQAGALDERPENSFRTLRVLAVIVPSLLFLATAWYDYTQVDDAARRRVTTTADAMAEHAQKVLETNQLVLSAIAERIAGLTWDEVRASESLHHYLLRITAQLPQLESAFIVDAGGKIAASSRGFPIETFDVTDRDYFRAARAGDGALFISAPFLGQKAGTRAFTVTRPATTDGVASGLVGVTLSPTYFEGFYAALADDAADSHASLIRQDGVFLVRYPARLEAARLMSAAGFLGQASIPVREGLVEGRSRYDGRMRLGAIRPVNGFPLAAAYSIDVQDYLAVWYQHIAVLAAFALVVIVVLSYSARAAIHHAHRERRQLQALLGETARREEAEDAVRQLQKIEALGRLTGGVAHDFNNLLTAIMGSLELAMKRVDEARVTRLLEGAMDAAKRGAKLTQHMLAFSRQQNVQMQPISVNDTLRGMDELLRRTITPEIRVQYTLDPALWPALADPTQLEVAVLNLAINARDAMPLGGTLMIRTRNVETGSARPAGVPAGELVLVTIADSGSGMTEDIRRRAVEPFFTTKGVGHGTGLGLSMVHGFALQAGGGFGIESSTGHGTAVHLYLPRSNVPPAQAAAPPAVEERTAPLDIVLVDDDAQVRELTAEMLRELGHRVTQFADGPAAIAHVAATPPSLMLLDYAMPVMNGGEVARAVTRAAAGPPILFITGYAEADALREWTARGFRVLTKPFTLPQLAAAVARSVRPAAANVVALRRDGRPG